MTAETDPLAVIAEDAPAFSDDYAVSIVRERYGLDVTARSLVSERDQNFHLQTPDGHQFVLKIANTAEDPEVTDLQIQGLLHIAEYVEANRTPVSAPKIRETLDGETHTMLIGSGGEHVARIVSYVEGVPIGNRMPSDDLSRQSGIYLAHLGMALRDFRHPGSKQDLLWDLQQALKLRNLLTHIPNESVKKDVGDALDDFEKFVLPEIASLRRQVIHSDFNPDNVLTDTIHPDVVCGVIDFGDMLEAPLIADLAIAASYVRPEDGNPLSLIVEMLAGYHGVTPLLQGEIDIFFELIKARLCASIAILYWRASFRDADDPYLEKLISGESFAEVFLSRLLMIPRENAQQIFRQVCASPSVPQGTAD